jgi:hypothetical protein
VTTQDGNEAARAIYRTVGQTSSFGGNPLEQHIGLGYEAHEISVDVYWPATKTRQHFVGVGKNQYIEIQEFTAEYTQRTRKSFPLGNPMISARRPDAPAQGKSE